ncbi:putative glyoxalase superfamily protein PhnB [Anaerotaenia torta]
MQFCFHFNESDTHIIENAYEVLSENADIKNPLGPCFFSPCMFGLIDRFGVNWCLFN